MSLSRNAAHPQASGDVALVSSSQVVRVDFASVGFVPLCFHPAFLCSKPLPTSLPSPQPFKKNTKLRVGRGSPKVALEIAHHFVFQQAVTEALLSNRVPEAQTFFRLTHNPAQDLGQLTRIGLEMAYKSLLKKDISEASRLLRNMVRNILQLHWAPSKIFARVFSHTQILLSSHTEHNSFSFVPLD